MKILTINCGSSSIKYALFQFPSATRLVSGVLERIGATPSQHHYQYQQEYDLKQVEETATILDHQQGLATILQALASSGHISDYQELAAIGHRVVHGGENFKQATLITPLILQQIRALSPLAPLHNPANILGIETVFDIAAQVPQVAIFDTAFHQTLPAHAYHYALPYALYEELQLRRYGFHGTSHHYLAQQAAQQLGKPLTSLNLITLHLGNGASACAIAQGQSVDTSMGLTPLEGLMMGSRSGDLDPAIIGYLATQKGWDITTIMQLLNDASGLKGIAGHNDMRTIIDLAAQGDARAQLARAMFVYRIKKYIGAYAAILGRLDALIFSGGIGEHDSDLRLQCCADLEILGIHADAEKNRHPASHQGHIETDAAKVALLVIPTDEELAIAQQVLGCLAD